jgi:hypothetical protein
MVNLLGWRDVKEINKIHLWRLVKHPAGFSRDNELVKTELNGLIY